MLTSLKKYGLPLLEDEQNEIDALTTKAVGIIRRLLSSTKHVDEGLSREALWKRYCHNEVDADLESRTAAFAAAIEQLEASRELQMTKKTVNALPDISQVGALQRRMRKHIRPTLPQQRSCLRATPLYMEVIFYSRNTTKRC